jgi:hypothetical protein
MNATLPGARTTVPSGGRWHASVWVRAWHILTWKHWAWATALGVLLGTLVPLQNLHINFYYTPWKIVYNTPFYVVFACVFLLAIAMVEASFSRSEWPSLWRYSSGAVAASLVCIGLTWSSSDLYPAAPRRVISGGSSNTQKTFSREQIRTDRVFGVGFDGVVHGWFATFIYVGLRNSRRAARALADAEVERSEAQRSLLAAQLLAAQSQVDPEFVMRTLEGIERIYEKEPAAADAQLDELIAFLRDAIPRLRSDERRTLRDPLKDPQGDER